jgi:hypothetical protein
MKTRIISRIPETECYICESTAIEKVCHHCGRAMCSEHGPFKPPTSQWYYIIENLEYTELDLEVEERQKGNEGIHCEHCVHHIISFEPIFRLLIAIGALSIFGGIFSAFPGLFIRLFIFGVAIIGISVGIIYIDRKDRLYGMLARRPPLPVMGRFPSIGVHESVKGAIALDRTGLYAVGDVKTEGTISFKLQLSAEDQERWKKYKRKYLLTRQSNIPFHVGFAVLRRAQMLQPDNWMEQDVNPILLTGHTANQSFFSNVVSLGNKQWSFNYKYSFSLDARPLSTLPIQIVPTLLSEVDEWALEFYVQVNPNIDIPSLTAPVIEKFLLEAPNGLDGIESHTPSASVQKGHNISVTWQNVRLQKERNNTAYSTILYVRFTNNKTIESGMEIRGKLVVNFEGIFSRLENVLLFSPIGAKRDDKDSVFVKRTDIILNFHFQLDCLHVRKLHPITSSIEQLTTIPGNEMITRLVNMMSDRDMYVQRVIENPPSMNRANAQIMNRLWVIAGRRYKGATPIDFRVIAIGQEQYEDSDKPYDGNTKFEITTQGTIINEQMKFDIETLRDDLFTLIQHIPILKIQLYEGTLYTNEYGRLAGIISNEGVTAKDITVSAMGIKIGETDSILLLEHGESRHFSLLVYPDKKGQVPIKITAVCKDEYGELPPTKKPCQIMVEERVTPSTTINQTTIHTTRTGEIHTGSGNIDVNRKEPF